MNTIFDILIICISSTWSFNTKNEKGYIKKKINSLGLNFFCLP